MTGNKNRLALDRLRIDPDRLGMAEGLGFTLVEHFHDAVIELADIHRALEQRRHILGFAPKEGHEFMVFPAIPASVWPSTRLRSM